MLYDLRTIYRDLRTGYVAVTQLGPNRTEFFALDKLEEAEAVMLEWARGANAYHSWGVFGEVPDSGRGKGDNIIAIPGLLLDWDIRVDADAHAKNDELPHDLDTILNLIADDGLPHPTAIVSSGNGYYGRYHLEAPLIFASPEERARGQQILHAAHDRFAAAFYRAGFHLDRVSDLPRITRHPGTLNHKTQPAKPVVLVSYEPDRTLTLDQLIALGAANKKTSVVVASSPRQITMASESSKGKDKGLPNFEAVQLGCQWVQSCVERAELLPEPEWYALGTIVERCEGGTDIFHELSALDPRYDHSETVSKLGRSTGPRTCEQIQAEFGSVNCFNCPFSDKIRSPILLGHHAPALIALQSQYVLDTQTFRYVNSRTGLAVAEKSFSEKFQHHFAKYTPHSVLVRSRMTRKVDGIDYRPGVPDRILPEAGGLSFFNTWYAPELVPEQGDHQLIDDHLKLLVPEVAEREHILDVLASSLQRPSQKVRHILTIGGGQGTGKSFLGALLKGIFGEKNSFTAVNADIVGRWTEPMGNRQLLLIEEFGLKDTKEAYEILKPWVTEEWHTVEEKNVPRHPARTPRLIVAFTNNQEPISISDDDRRIFLTYSGQPKRDKLYYDRLFSEGIRQAPALAYTLLHRNIEHFSPDAPPPVTTSKLGLVKASRPAAERELAALLDEQCAPFDRDLVQRQEVVRAIAPNISVMANKSAEAVARAMVALGFARLPQQVRLRDYANSKVRLWAWRNQEKWLSATMDEVRAEYLKAS